MKFPLALAVVLICSQATSAFFFGANIVLPQSKDLSSAMKKCSTSLAKAEANLSKIVSTANKFSQSGYDGVAKGFTDVIYMIDELQTFINSFMSSLNNQTTNQTLRTSVKIIENLDYQITVKVIPGIETTLTSLAPVVGGIFGQAAEDIINTISKNFVDELTSVSQSITTIKNNTQVIIDDGYDRITVDDISTDALQQLVQSFKDLVDTCGQLETIITAIASTINTLDADVTILQATLTSSTTMITKATYDLDVSVQASKRIFTSKLLTYQDMISLAFGNFQSLSASLFTGDEDVLLDRANAEAFVTDINTMIDTVSSQFNTFATETSLAMTTAINVLQSTVSSNTQKIIDFITKSATAGASAVSKCLGPTTNSMKTAQMIIQALAANSTTCIKNQQNTAMAAQSLMSFIVGDVVLNAQGAADTLCSCSVGGGKKDKDKSKKCIHSVVTELDSVKFEDANYLTTESLGIRDIFKKSQSTFTDCSINVGTNFDASFQTFQDTVNACLATGRTGLLR